MLSAHGELLLPACPRLEFLEKEENAKLIRDARVSWRDIWGELEPAEEPELWRIWLCLEGSSWKNISAGGDTGDTTRTIVRVLDDERFEFSFRSQWVPYGSPALTEPRRLDKRRWVGEDMSESSGAKRVAIRAVCKGQGIGLTKWMMACSWSK